jgi:uncharacterized protein
VAIANLVRLGLLADRLDYLTKAEEAMHSFGQVISNSPVACPSLINAAMWLRNHTLARTTTSQYQKLKNQYHPFVLFEIDTELRSDCIAIVCQGFTCMEPAISTEQLQKQLISGKSDAIALRG